MKGPARDAKRTGERRGFSCAKTLARETNNHPPSHLQIPDINFHVILLVMGTEVGRLPAS